MTHYCVTEQQTDSAHIWPSSVATAISSLVSFHEDEGVNVLPKRFLTIHLQPFNKRAIYSSSVARGKKKLLIMVQHTIAVVFQK